MDDAEHDHGVFSQEANKNLEAIDAMLSQLAAAARELDRSAFVIVVSDHGFTPMHHEVNLFIPFVKAGLMTIHKNQETHATEVVAVAAAQPWLADGMGRHHAARPQRCSGPRDREQPAAKSRARSAETASTPLKIRSS